MPHVGREFVLGQAQERVCVCRRPQAFSDDFGRCTKCGHQAEPEPPSAPSWAVTEPLNHPL